MYILLLLLNFYSGILTSHKMDSSVDVPTQELNELNSLAQGDRGEGEAAAINLSPKSKEIMQSDEHSYVQDMVTHNRVVVFSKTHCPHCSDSKTLLSDMGVEYKTVELDQMNNGGKVQNVLGRITDARTVRFFSSLAVNSSLAFFQHHRK